VQRVLATRPAQFFGNISYSWYLFHYVWLILPLYIGTGANGRTNRVLEVLGGLGCAIASYYLVENPLRRATWLTRDPWMSLALLVAAMLLVVDATLLVQHLLPAAI
jgi:peptidoglycan/LPS O-acetylase OafA/YrhL